MTPLHYACERSCIEQVESILSHCKDNITDKNNDGLTPLDIVKHRVQDDGLDTAEKHRIEDMVTLIRNNGGTTGREEHNTDQDPGVWLDSVCTISSASPTSMQSVESPINTSDTLSNLGDSHQQSYQTNYDCQQTYEDHLASEILNLFPEISEVLGAGLEQE